jgi:hypothetical protein
MATSGLEWFRPLWRRVAVVVFCFGWSGWEWLGNHDQTWGIITLGLVAYSVWTFFITFDRKMAAEDAARKDQPPPPAA